MSSAKEVPIEQDNSKMLRKKLKIVLDRLIWCEFNHLEVKKSIFSVHGVRKY